jgi:phosphatidylinositol kinase/protein kinase (PI-3  family)
MHLALLERWPHPGTWYTRRLAYTRSASVSSFVGYIVGIGDRHPQNILIDTVTAQLVHIDFGIAFDQVRENGKRRRSGGGGGWGKPIWCVVCRVWGG